MAKETFLTKKETLTLKTQLLNIYKPFRRYINNQTALPKVFQDFIHLGSETSRGNSVTKEQVKTVLSKLYKALDTFPFSKAGIDPSKIFEYKILITDALNDLGLKRFGFESQVDRYSDRVVPKTYEDLEAVVLRSTKEKRTSTNHHTSTSYFSSIPSTEPVTPPQENYLQTIITERDARNNNAESQHTESYVVSQNHFSCRPF